MPSPPRHSPHSAHDRGKFSIGSCHMRCKPAHFLNRSNFSASSRYLYIRATRHRRRPPPKTPRSSRTFSAALIFAADLVVGVIEISRKGANSKPAGPDFTSEDLGKALALSDEDS